MRQCAARVQVLPSAAPTWPCQVSLYLPTLMWGQGQASHSLSYHFISRNPSREGWNRGEILYPEAAKDGAGP